MAYDLRRIGQVPGVRPAAMLAAQHSKTGGLDRLVLLTIALHCDEWGEAADLELSQVAHLSNLAPDRVERCLERLREAGELEVREAGTAGRPHQRWVLARAPRWREAEKRVRIGVGL